MNDDEAEDAWTIDALVDRLVAARRGGPRLGADAVMRAVDSPETAYRVQARVDAALWPDAEARCWKAGADSRDSLPTAAAIASPLVYASVAALPAASFGMRIIEAEVAYRFGVDLPPRAVPYSADEVAEAVTCMLVAIEVVDPRIDGFATAAPHVKLADHLLNGALVLGSGIEDWRGVDLRRQKATLSIDGKVHEAVEGSHGLGNPAVLLPWFVAWLGRGRGVRAGDVVTTGSWTRVVEAGPKQRVDAVFPGIGSATATFVD